LIRAVRVKMGPRQVPALVENSPQLRYVELQHAGEIAPSGIALPPPDQFDDPLDTQAAGVRVGLAQLGSPDPTGARIALLDTGIDEPATPRGGSRDALPRLQPAVRPGSSPTPANGDGT
jgi:hypothetical protein